MKQRRIITGIMTLVLVAAMVGMAELLAEPEIIFPEIAALAVGAWVAPRCLWRTSRLRLVLLIALFSLLGICIVRYLPLPLYVQLLLAFAAVSAGLILSGTTFAPVISAMVLPVLLGTTSGVYPLAATILAALVAAAQGLLERRGLYPRSDFIPLHPTGGSWLALLKRLLVAAGIVAAALAVDWRFCVAPPLLVVLTEFSSPQCPARRFPLKAWLLISGCALAGAACRLLLSVALGMPLTIAAVAATAIVLLVQQRLETYLPPAGALAILPMLIPAAELWLYPLEILIGCALMIAAALLLFREDQASRGA